MGGKWNRWEKCQKNPLPVFEENQTQIKPLAIAANGFSEDCEEAGAWDGRE